MSVDLRDYSGQQTGQHEKTWVYERTGKRRAYVIPANPQTPEQQVGRMRFKDLCTEFLDLGGDLRVQLRAALGYRWHARLLGWALGYGALRWGLLEDEYSTFSAENQAAWAAFDGALNLENQPGFLFFLASSVVHQAIVYYARVEPFDKPAAGNAANIAAAWPREVIMFPVGSIFISVDSTNPSGTLGYGSWEAFGAGRVLVGLDANQTEFDTVGEIGGAKTHTLTSGEMPAHTHVTGLWDQGSGFYVGTWVPYPKGNNPLATQSAGGGGAHNNLQPYIVVYMWKRTA